MTTNDPKELFQLKEKHAVHHLLQVAENKIITEEHWHTPIRLQTRKRRKDKNKFEHKNIRIRQNPESTQRHIEKQKLKEFVDQTISNQGRLKTQQQNQPAEPNRQQQLQLTLKFIKNAKLRPFNSNMTFYSIKKQGKAKFISSNISFYSKNKRNDNVLPSCERKSEGLFSQKEMKRFQETGVLTKDQKQKSAVYFTSNKSETVRQLLNRMSLQKTKQSKVLLNSTEREAKNEDKNTYDEPYSQRYLSQQQLKQLNRYSKFFPFQKDEQLLYRKISEVDSIWLNKFKQSWQRSKQTRNSRSRYLKKLIVK